jgi:hypothetical protein
VAAVAVDPNLLLLEQVEVELEDIENLLVLLQVVIQDLH